MHFTPDYPTSCGWRSACRVGVRPSLNRSWAHPKPVEELSPVTRASSIESKRILIQVIVQVFTAHSALVRPDQPVQQGRTWGNSSEADWLGPESRTRADSKRLQADVTLPSRRCGSCCRPRNLAAGTRGCASYGSFLSPRRRGDGPARLPSAQSHRSRRPPRDRCSRPGRTIARRSLCSNAQR